MAFVKVNEILKMADKAGTSALAFNATDFNMIYAVTAVAEELQKPVIIMLYPEHHHLNNAVDPSGFANIVKNLAEQVKVPIALHLDHCSDYNYAVDALRCGFTSIMYDGSMLPVEENIINTKRIVEIASIFGADVEGELGRVGFANQNDENKKDLYTQPDVAKRYCEETGVISVAVAIGSAHGVYKEAPKLDIERLKEINKATGTYLVLHGGSGIPEDQMALAFANGINKLNIGTEFFQLNYDSIKEYCDTYKEKGNVFEMPKFVQNKLAIYLREKFTISSLTV